MFTERNREVYDLPINQIIQSMCILTEPNVSLLLEGVSLIVGCALYDWF